MPMHSRKKLQKKETSAPIPKKYLEYEASQGGVVRGSTLKPSTLARHHSNICMSCFMTGDPDKEELINHHQPEEFGKG